MPKILHLTWENIPPSNGLSALELGRMGKRELAVDWAFSVPRETL
jgi:hypothetical protein